MKMKSIEAEILFDDRGRAAGYCHNGEFYPVKNVLNYWGMHGSWHICSACNWSGYTSVTDTESGGDAYCPECGVGFYNEKKDYSWMEENPWGKKQDIEYPYEEIKKWEKNRENEERRRKEEDEYRREEEEKMRRAEQEAKEYMRRIEEEEKKRAVERKAEQAQKRAAARKKAAAKKNAIEKARAKAARPLPSVPSVTGEHARKINWN